jgi:long-chain fatty acid transport protein
MQITPFFVLAAMVLAPTAGFSLGFRLADMDAYATGRANAFTATADNASAIYYNPAGITQLDELSVRLGAYGIGIEDTFEAEAEAAEDLETANELQGTPSLYVAYHPGKEPIAMGIGVYSPYGLGNEWPEEAPFRNIGLRGRIAYVTVNPVVALQVSRTFSVAAGFTVNYAQARLEQGIQSQPDNFKFKGDGTAYGFTLGALWQPLPQHSFGIKYHSATEVTFSGHSKAKLSDQQRAAIREGNAQIRKVRHDFGPFADSILRSVGAPTEEIAEGFPEEDADAEVQFPQFIIVGYSFRPTPEWNFEINVDWTDWDSLNTVTLQQRSGRIDLPFNYTSSFFWEFGVTRSFQNGFHVSSGYIYSENSVPESQFNPVVPDSDRHLFTVGIGQKLARYSWDLAYQFGYGPERTINNEGPADGEYRFLSHALTVSLGYNF